MQSTADVTAYMVRFWISSYVFTVHIILILHHCIPYTLPIHPKICNRLPVYYSLLCLTRVVGKFLFIGRYVW